MPRHGLLLRILRRPSAAPRTGRKGGRSGRICGGAERTPPRRRSRTSAPCRGSITMVMSPLLRPGFPHPTWHSPPPGSSSPYPPDAKLVLRAPQTKDVFAFSILATTCLRSAPRCGESLAPTDPDPSGRAPPSDDNACPSRPHRACPSVHHSAPNAPTRPSLPTAHPRLPSVSISTAAHHRPFFATRRRLRQDGRLNN